jgi:SAM-dependent methyltransferase
MIAFIEQRTKKRLKFREFSQNIPSTILNPYNHRAELKNMNRKSLDLGCSKFPRNPYNYEELHGIDLTLHDVAGVVYKQANLALEKIPYEDNHFDCISAFDFIEHIPRQLLSLDTGKTRAPFIELMNEIWRTLKPGGIFYAVTPAYPAAEAFQDPTHVNFITKNTHQYFCGVEPMAKIYGFTGKFTKIRVESLVFRTAITAEKTFAKTVYNWQKRILKPSRVAHLLWELKAEK